MSGPVEESLVTNGGLIALPDPEQILLYVAHALHYESNGVKYYACNISACSKRWLRIPGNVWGVQHRHWQGYNPNPQHLSDPESQKREELVPLVIKTVVFAGFYDPE